MKNALQISLVAALLVGLSGCGSSSGNGNAVDNGTTIPIPPETYGANKIFRFQPPISTSALKYNKLTLTLDNRTYRLDDTINFKDFRAGYRDGIGSKEAEGIIVSVNRPFSESKEFSYRLFNQYFVAVMGIKNQGEAFTVPVLAGVPTQKLPQQGKAHYAGEAFNETEKGSFSYDVDFVSKKGKGIVQGFGNDITLQESAISPIEGKAIMPFVSEPDKKYQAFAYITEQNGYPAGSYTLALFGPDAEEIAGSLNAYDNEIALIGRRGNITK